jgi:hypothetical protein
VAEAEIVLVLSLFLHLKMEAIETSDQGNFDLWVMDRVCNLMQVNRPLKKKLAKNLHLMNIVQ